MENQTVAATANVLFLMACKRNLLCDAFACAFLLGVMEEN